MLSPNHNLWQEIIINGAGLTSLYLGIIPLFSRGYLRIDKQNKQLIFKGGFKRLIFSYYQIPFSEINRIEINNELKYRFGSGSYWDVMTLILTNKNDIEVDFSNNDEYLNWITFKISQFTGCGIYNKNLI